MRLGKSQVCIDDIINKLFPDVATYDVEHAGERFDRYGVQLSSETKIGLITYAAVVVVINVVVWTVAYFKYRKKEKGEEKKRVYKSQFKEMNGSDIEIVSIIGN